MIVNATIRVCQFVYSLVVPRQCRTAALFILAFLHIFVIIIIFVLNMSVHSSTQLQSKALLHNPLQEIFLFNNFSFLVSLQIHNFDTSGVVYSAI